MKRLPVAGLLALLAAGCAAVPPRPTAPAAAVWSTRQAALARLSAWDLRGRMALRTPEESLQAGIRWVRRDDRHEIDLVGPLGGGHVRLTHDAKGARLRAADERVYEAPDPEQLLERATGWRLPLAGMHYWVLGLPAPAAPATETLDDYGRLRTLQQLGWSVQFLAYREHQGHDLPSRLYITRRLPEAAAEPGTEAQLELRMVINRWDFVR